MSTKSFISDEPIHHRMGEVQLDACPSEPPSAQQGKSYSPISSAPPCGNLSGPRKEPKRKNQSMVKRAFAKFFKRDNSKQQISITVLNFNGNIVFEDSTVIDESTIIESLTKIQQEKLL